MKLIPSTAEILALKMLGRNMDKRWTDWAYDMLCAGFDTENLIILAGETAPYNFFHAQRLTDKVFDELNLTWDNRELIYKNYVCYLITKALDNEVKMMNALATMKNLYMELDYERNLVDFYNLYFAYEDLTYSRDQYYWRGATRENIEEIVRQYFMEWRTNNGYELS